jgi:chromate transporter
VNSASPPGPARLFGEFARVGLSGFGGVLPFVRRAVVERNGWLDDRGFTELLGIAQVMPGPNVVNLAVMLGYRYAGLLGALFAFSGLVLVPMALLLAIVFFYYRFGDVAGVRGALRGMMAVSAGLILATGFKLATGLPRHLRALVPMLLALVAVGFLRLPLVPVVLVLLPLCLALEWRAGRRSARDEPLSSEGRPPDEDR